MMLWVLLLASPVLLFLIVAIGLIVYSCGTTWWTNKSLKHIPGVKSSLQLLGKHNGEVHLAIRDSVNTFGLVSRITLVVVPLTIVADPEAAKHVLMTKNFPKGTFYDAARVLFGDGLVVSEGEKWKRHRKLMTAGFTPGQLKSMLPSFQHHTEELCATILRDIQNKKSNVVHIDKYLTHVTLDIIATTALRFNLNSLHGDNPEIGRAFHKLLSGTADSALNLFPYGAYLTKLMVRKESKVVDGVINKAIEQALQSPLKHDDESRDLMDLLLSARDPQTGARMTTKEMRDELFIFFLAGHETTALTLTFCLHELSLVPDVMKKLQEEIEQVCQGEMPQYEHLNQLKYTTMVLKVSAWVAIDAIHHREDIYPDPFTFNPERWTEEETAKRHPYSFLPFTQGPRICIGQHFFWMEGRVLLARLVQKFHFQRSEGFNPVITSRTGTMKFKDGLELVLTPRS